MSRTYCLLGCVVVLALMTVPVWAETARVQGMGYTMIAVGTDAGAWYNNSALVSRIDLLGTPGSDWGTRAAVTTEVNADWDATSVDVSLRQQDGRRGFGVGYMSFEDEDIFGAAYGQACNWVSGLFWGVNVINFSWDNAGTEGGDDNDTLFNIGLAYEPQLDSSPVRTRFGAEVWDVTNQWDTQLNLGAAGYWPNGFVLAADLLDVFDMAVFDVGAEYNMDGFSGRLGVADGDFTAGVGYHQDRWELGISYGNTGFGDDSVAVMVGSGF